MTGYRICKMMNVHIAARTLQNGSIRWIEFLFGSYLYFGKNELATDRVRFT
jgi:hypothetical protein